MAFSERFGYKKGIGIQKEEMSIELRSSLWNCLKLAILNNFGDYRKYADDDSKEAYKKMSSLSTSLWFSFFKKTLDSRPRTKQELSNILKNRFIGDQWYEVYDLIEFIISTHVDSNEVDYFTKFLNQVLQRENSGYRIVASLVTPITSDKEIEEIENASNNPLASAGNHISRAIIHLSNRVSPDYRNSIKESISAVEALCKSIAGKKDGTLKDALDEIEKDGKIKIHSALKSAYEKIYGYTSGSDGIRHALLEEERLDFEDALFFLVSCSAFINYLTQKSYKSGINLKIT